MSIIRTIWLLLVGTFSICWSSTAKTLDAKFSYQCLKVSPDNQLWIGTSSGLYTYRNDELVGIPRSSEWSVTALELIHQHVVFGTRQGLINMLPSGGRISVTVAKLNRRISGILYQDQTVWIATQGQGIYRISRWSVQHYTKSTGLPDNFIYKIASDEKGDIWFSCDQGLYRMFGSIQSPTYISQKVPAPLVNDFCIRGAGIWFITQQGQIGMRPLAGTGADSTTVQFTSPGQLNSILKLDHQIMLGTQRGLFILDAKFSIRDSLSVGTPVYCLQHDLEGNIIYGGKNSLELFAGEQFEWIQKLAQHAVHHVHSILALDSAVWFTPDQGLLGWSTDNNHCDEYTLTHPDLKSDITSIQHVEDTIYCSTSNYGLYRILPKALKWESMPLPDSLPANSIISSSFTRESICLGTLNGIWEKKSYESSFTCLEEKGRHEKLLVNHILPISGGYLFSTDGDGLIEYRNGQFKPLSQQLKIQSMDFYHAGQDTKGRIWTNARNAGLFCIEGNQLFHLTTEQGLSDNEILGFDFFKKKYIVLVTSKGIDLINLETFSITRYDASSFSVSFEPEYQSISCNEDAVYIGTNAGILQFRIPEYRTLFEPQAIITDLKVLNSHFPLSTTTFDHEQNYFSFSLSDRSNTGGLVYYRYRLLGLSDIWSVTSNDEIVFPRLPPGEYTLEVSNSNNRQFYQASVHRYSFTITPPFWKRVWFIVVIGLIGLYLAWIYIRFREKNLNKIQELEKEKAIAELEVLKNQVSPHFLFNSFNTLLQVIEEDQEKAMEYTSRLSDFYRSILSYRTKNLITLEEELNVLDNYIFLQKMRFEDALLFRLPESTQLDRQYWIPPLTLQLLAENAIKHNRVSIQRPLSIQLQIVHQTLEFSNNIQRKTNPEKGEGIGLHNIRNRFKSLNTKPVQVVEDGIHFKVCIPLIRLTEDTLA